MKTKLLSIMLVLTLLVSFAACGKTETTVNSGSAQSAAASEVTEEKKPWFDEEAYHARLEAAGIPYELNDDGSKPAEWTMEYYMTDDYADCDNTVEEAENGYYTSKSAVVKYLDLNAIDSKMEDTVLNGLPQEQTMAMFAADLTRAFPDTPVMDEKTQERIIDDVKEYVKDRGAEEYPFMIFAYSIPDGYYIPKDIGSVELIIYFLNDKLSGDELFNVQPFYGSYSTKDYACQGYEGLSKAIDSTYGEGTYTSLHEELVGDLIDDARSRTQAQD